MATKTSTYLPDWVAGDTYPLTVNGTVSPPVAIPSATLYIKSGIGVADGAATLTVSITTTASANGVLVADTVTGIFSAYFKVLPTQTALLTATSYYWTVRLSGTDPTQDRYTPVENGNMCVAQD